MSRKRDRQKRQDRLDWFISIVQTYMHNRSCTCHDCMDDIYDDDYYYDDDENFFDDYDDDYRYEETPLGPEQEFSNDDDIPF